MDARLGVLSLSKVECSGEEFVSRAAGRGWKLPVYEDNDEYELWLEVIILTRRRRSVDDVVPVYPFEPRVTLDLLRRRTFLRIDMDHLRSITSR